MQSDNQQASAQPFRLGLQARLLVPFVVMATLPALLIGALAYRNATSTIQESVNEQLISISDLKEMEIEGWVRLIESDATLLADNILNEEHITVILDPEADPMLQADFGTFLTENLLSLQAARSGYVEIYYMDRSGRIVLSTNSNRVGDQADQVIVEELFGSEGEKYFRDIHPQEDSFEMAFSQVMHQVDFDQMEATDVVNAAVVIRVDVEQGLFPILENWPERGDTGDSYLVKPIEGEFFALSPLRFDGRDPLSAAMPNSLQDPEIYKPPMSLNDQIHQLTDYRGEEVLHINRAIDGTEWVLVVEKDISEAFMPVEELGRIWALVTVAILLMAVGVAAVLSRRLTHPILMLAAAAKRVGQGELDTQVDVYSQDEIGELAAAFNNMVTAVRTNAARIMRRREELQALVNLSDTFLGSLDVDVALESALHETLTATQFEAGLAVLLNDDENELVTRAEVGLADELVGSRYPVNRLTVAGYCVLQRTTVQTADLDRETRFRAAPTVRAIGVRSALAVPLAIGLRVVGAMVFYFREPHDFQTDEVQLVQAIANQTASALERIELINDLSDSYDRTLQALVAALDARDKETEGHSRRIVAYTLALAKTYGVPEEDLEDIARGALLHDIGKIGVPDAILHKPAALTDAEWAVIRKHPEWGKQILDGIPFLELPAEMVLTHHERWDGSGYPQGLAEEDIPVGARIFAIVDAFDAITSNRPYRKASDFRTAQVEIQSQRGKQFDPHVVDIFMQFSEKDWQQVLREDAIFQSPTGLKRATGELDPRQLALADHIQAMNKIVEAITSSLDIEDVLEKALKTLVQETTVTGAGIFLHDEPSDEVRYAADVLLPDQLKQSIDGVTLGELEERSLVGETGTRFCRDLRDIPALVRAEVPDARPEWLTYCSIRLTVDDARLGLLVLFSEKPHVFSSDEQALFDRVGRLLAQALQNARAHERVRHQAITDALTGAYNRHYLDDFLEIEVRRCARYQRPMALLLVDMDDFKGCNDRGGHQAGDQALKAVVRILNLGVRSVDMVARYGGEEFVVVLPETDHEGSMDAAERLRRQIDRHEFPCGKLTASIGVVSTDYSNGDSPNPEELFGRADRALFQAKQAGRNRVVMWSEDE